MIAVLMTRVNIPEEELIEQYDEFIRNYPEGKITEDEFNEMFGEKGVFSASSLFRIIIFPVSTLSFSFCINYCGCIIFLSDTNYKKNQSFRRGQQRHDGFPGVHHGAQLQQSRAARGQTQGKMHTPPDSCNRQIFNVNQL